MVIESCHKKQAEGYRPGSVAPQELGASGDPGDPCTRRNEVAPLPPAGAGPEEAAKTGSKQNSASQRDAQHAQVQLNITPQTRNQEDRSFNEKKKKRKRIDMCQLPDHRH